MTDAASPESPAKFAHPDDVKARYVEGEFPADKAVWAQTRIEDTESILIGLVASLDAPVSEIDPARLRRVRALVADKVLELYRNPQGKQAVTSDMEGLSERVEFRGARSNAVIGFTKQELDSVRLRKKRSRFGTIPVGPGMFRSPC